MTLNLTPEERKERRKIYKREYTLKYYHLIKETEPEKYREWLDKANKRIMAKYNKEKEEKGIEGRKQTKRNIKVTLDNLVVTASP